MPGMRRLLAILVLFAGLTGASPAKPPAPSPSPAVAVPPREGVSHGRTTEAQVMEHLLEMAKALPPGKVASRGAVGDLAYPRDSAENSAMAGYALLMVTTVTRDPEELPLASVRVQMQEGSLPLQRIGRTLGPVRHPEVVRLFGPHRGAELYYLPIAFTRLPCSVQVDFAANRKNLEVMRFPPAPDADGWSKNMAILKPGAPDPVAVAALAEREFGWKP